MAFPWSGTSLDAFFFLSTTPVEGESEVYYADLTLLFLVPVLVRLLWLNKDKMSDSSFFISFFLPPRRPKKTFSET